MVARRAASQQLTEEEIAHAGRWLHPLPSSWWRWEEAARLAKLKASERHCNHPDISAAADFLATLEACRTRDEQAKVLRRWPDIVRRTTFSEGTAPSVGAWKPGSCTA